MKTKIVIKDLFDNGITEILCTNKEEANTKVEQIKKENLDFGIEAEIKIIDL